MFKTRLIAAASAAAIAIAALSAPAFAATTMKKPAEHHMVAKPVMKKPVHHMYVSGKIVKIYKAESMIKLSNGKTYRISAKALAKFKVGEHVHLRIS